MTFYICLLLAPGIFEGLAIYYSVKFYRIYKNKKDIGEEFSKVYKKFVFWLLGVVIFGILSLFILVIIGISVFAVFWGVA